jgi:hypothetical protein
MPNLGREALEVSEIAVLVIRVREGQADDYERLFAQNQLPRWRD